MVANILVGMLCANLLCFSVMFWLVSKRLHGKKMGMDFFAMGNLLLGSAYVLQLAEGGPAWSLVSVVNHTFTLASPVAYWLGAMRFFGHSVPLWRPLLAVAVTYSAAQVLVQWSLGPVARYAMLSGMSALLFLAMVITVVYGVRTFAKDLYGEMIFFAVLISGICVLNALKFMKLVDGGLNALHMDSNFQLVFYIYMSSLATVLPPSIIWLVLRRLTDDLRDMAARDPMTQLLNRRGLTEALQRYFTSRKAVPAHLLMVDVDHFKRINDTYGHQVGDTPSCARWRRYLVPLCVVATWQPVLVVKSLLSSAWTPTFWASCTWLSAYAQPSKIKPSRSLALTIHCTARSRLGFHTPSPVHMSWRTPCEKPTPPFTGAKPLDATGSNRPLHERARRLQKNSLINSC